MQVFGYVVVDDAGWAVLPDVLDVNDVALLIRRHQQTVWYWLQNGDVPAHRVGHSWVIYKESVRRALEYPDKPATLPDEFLAGFPEELSLDDVARLFGRKKMAIYRWLNAGYFGRKWHNRWDIKKSEVIQLLRDTANHPLPPPENVSQPQ